MFPPFPLYQHTVNETDKQTRQDELIVICCSQETTVPIRPVAGFRSSVRRLLLQSFGYQQQRFGQWRRSCDATWDTAI